MTPDFTAVSTCPRCGHIAYHLTDHTTRTCRQCEWQWGEH